ncbi:MAG TPA: PilZ domain-containing protein [Oscillospiraceae bacterium]|nr:PilZ domain-containing protein [Oscillospiraceae bacterium]
MGVFSQLKVGDRLSIERLKKNAVSGEKNILNAQLIDLHGGYIYISAPIYKGKRYFLSDGQNIGIFFYRDSAVYQFYAEVVKQADTGIEAFIVKSTSNLCRIQRRNHYRLPVVMDVIIEKELNGQIHRLECIAKDLSGGGIRVICNEELAEGKHIKVELCLHNENRIMVDGKVMRTIKNTTTDSYELGIKFDKISRLNEDKIYSFIFERQRLLRKMGLI